MWVPVQKQVKLFLSSPWISLSTSHGGFFFVFNVMLSWEWGEHKTSESPGVLLGDLLTQGVHDPPGSSPC
jgi:hypothetical protein